MYIIALFMSSKIKFDVLNTVGCSCKCVVVKQLEYSFFFKINKLWLIPQFNKSLV